MESSPFSGLLWSQSRESITVQATLERTCTEFSPPVLANQRVSPPTSNNTPSWATVMVLVPTSLPRMRSSAVRRSVLRLGAQSIATEPLLVPDEGLVRSQCTDVVSTDQEVLELMATSRWPPLLGNSRRSGDTARVNCPYWVTVTRTAAMPVPKNVMTPLRGLGVVLAWRVSVTVPSLDPLAGLADSQVRLSDTRQLTLELTCRVIRPPTAATTTGLGVTVRKGGTNSPA